VGTAALGLAMGPAGLVAAAGLAAIGIYQFAKSLDDGKLGADEAKSAADDLASSLANLAKGGTDTKILGVLAETADEYARLARLSQEHQKGLDQTNAKIAGFREEASYFDVSTQAGINHVNMLDMQIKKYEAMGEAQASQILTADQYNEVQSDSIHLLTNLNNLNADTVTARYEELWQEWERGKISAADLAWNINYLDENSATYGVTLEEIARQQRDLNSTTVELTAAQKGLQRILGEQRGDAQDDYWEAERKGAEDALAASNAFLAGQANRGADGAKPPDIRQIVAQNLLGLGEYTAAQNELGLAANAADAELLEQTRTLLAFAQSAAEASTSTAVLDGAIRTIVGGTGDLTSGIDAVNTSLSGLTDAADGYSVLQQLVDENRISQTEYDNALVSATNSQYNANEAALDGATIQAKQAPLLAELAYQQMLYVDEISKLPAEQQLLALAYMDSAEAGKALELQTLAISAANGELGEGGGEFAADIIEGAAAADPILKAMLVDMGLISVGADGTVSVNMAGDGVSELEALNTTLQQLQGSLEVILKVDLNDDDVIGYVPPTLPDAEIKVKVTAAAAVDQLLAFGGVGPDGGGPAVKLYADTSGAQADLDAWVATAGSTQATVEVDGGTGRATTALGQFLLDVGAATPVLNIGGDSSGATSAADGAVGYVSGLDGVIDIGANTSPYYNSLPATGQTIGTNYIDVVSREAGRIGFTQFADGGLIDHAAVGGMRRGMVLVGERGPELVSLPGGSLVHNNSASRGMRGNGGGGDTVTINIGTVVANDARQFAESMRRYDRTGRNA
ncbi:MAG: hypothetical protein WKF60_08440, partial [Ilumatobacter sp.]